LSLETERVIAQEQTRVRADLLDKLVSLAGGVNILQARLAEQVGDYRSNLTELDQTVTRLGDQLRNMAAETEAQILFRHEQDEPTSLTSSQLEFDPLELDRYSDMQQLSRSLLESVNDLQNIKEFLEGLTRESESLLLQQAKVGTELQQGLIQTRMTRFDELIKRFSRIVRQSCSAQHKKASFVMEGGELEIERSVYEKIAASIDHILRNAMAHGIESPDQRRHLNKPEAGQIQVILKREGNDVLITVRDDGAGMDLALIRKTAEQKGLIKSSQQLSDDEIRSLVLIDGFSTAREIDLESGRGVGMSVVRDDIKKMGGSLIIGSEKGFGTEFLIRLPQTLAVAHCLLVKVVGETYAIPVMAIEGVTQLSVEQLSHYYQDRTLRYEYSGFEYEVQSLASVLEIGVPDLESEQVTQPLIMLKAGQRRVAIHADLLLGRQDLVVKPTGRQVSAVRGIAGASILSNGHVVLVLDLGAFIRSGGDFSQEAEQQSQQLSRELRQPKVLVVDDSITMRRVTERALQRYNLNVTTAKDGVDALAHLGHSVPDLMLLDIEMPKMDGYEVASYMQKNEALNQVPIIMITSRTGEKHREKAESLGVKHYLGKPYQESDLLARIKLVLKEVGLDEYLHD